MCHRERLVGRFIRIAAFGCAAVVVGMWVGSLPAQQRSAIVQGQVVDEHGRPMVYVNVQLVGSFDGDVSDSSGTFLFSTRHFGRQQIRATRIGYEASASEVRLSPGDTADVRLVLKETLIQLGEAVVTASAFSTGDRKGVTLHSIEVVTTPGAAADILRAIKSFPGIAMVDEGSGLFVRGGDVTETVTLLDQATVVHPYRYESPTGGVFGTISAFLVRGTFFSSGGFSARYGNALSGVLAMESQGMPERSQYTVGLGLAAAAAAFETTLANGRLGLRFSGNRSFTEAMFRLNGRRHEFTVTPRGTDGNLSLIYRYSDTGRLKVFNYVSENRLGVHVDEPSFDGIFRGEENNRLHNLQWSELWHDWVVKTSLSLNRFRSRRQLGNFDLEQEDDTYKLRTDWEKRLAHSLNLATGAEVERTSNRFAGQVPIYRNVFDPQSSTYTLEEAYAAARLGAYVDAEARLGRRWFAQLGLRVDHHSLAAQSVLDPRVSLRYQWSRSINFRFSWGIYHQFPQPYLYNAVTGNPGLRAQQAQHFVGTFERRKGNTLLRLEAYYKPYRKLVIEDNALHYANTGGGYSRGVDFFWKYGAFLQTRFNGWISYSFLQSRRRQARDTGGTYLFETAPSDFDITHNLTVVAKARLYQMLSLGVSYRYATGRPVTPIAGANRQQPYDYYVPIEGPVNSERLPSFQRLDANLSLYVPFANGNAMVFYLSVANLLDRANVLNYDYSADYSTRKRRETNYRRFVYFGVTATLLGW